MSTISSFRGEWAFLSNFYPIPVSWGNSWFPSVEHAYQAAKAIKPQDIEIIRNATTAAQAKKLAKKIEIHPNWNEIKLEWMEYLVWYKFAMFPDMGKKLLSTGNAELIEGNTWGDRFWGRCNGSGENWLGRLLMKVRDQIKEAGVATKAPLGANILRFYIEKPNHIFVFGSNLAGVHGAGAAKNAHDLYGAIWGVGEGLAGNSYALPTKDEQIQTLSLSAIKKYVNKFVEFAWERTDLTFFITRIGCGLAGYKDEDISPLFEDCPPNCDLPYGWEITE